MSDSPTLPGPRTKQWLVMLSALVLLLTVISLLWPAVWQYLSPPSVNLAHTEQRQGVRLHQGQPFTGRALAYHANGQTALREHYRDGLRHGLSEHWSETGTLIEQRSYAAGEKVGRHQGWWPTGSKRFQMNFEGGVLQGAVEYWHANGFMASRLQFAEGRESGPQRSWKSDGSSESAYDMVEGRRYGVIDSTACPTLPGSAAQMAQTAKGIASHATESIAPRAYSKRANSQFGLKTSATLPFYTDSSFAPQWLPEDAEKVHQLGDFHLTNQSGQPVQSNQLAQGLTVVNFFFAGCSQVCPSSMAFLREIQQNLKQEASQQRGSQSVQFWVISIDPLSDTPQALSSYAQRLQLSEWQLLTGSPEAVEQLAKQSFFAKSRLEAHTERAYLIDSQRRIRGIYNATQRADMLRLREDIWRLQRMRSA